MMKNKRNEVPHVGSDNAAMKSLVEIERLAGIKSDMDNIKN